MLVGVANDKMSCTHVAGTLQRYWISAVFSFLSFFSLPPSARPHRVLPVYILLQPTRATRLCGCLRERQVFDTVRLGSRDGRLVVFVRRCLKGIKEKHPAILEEGDAPLWVDVVSHSVARASAFAKHSAVCPVNTPPPRAASRHPPQSSAASAANCSCSLLTPSGGKL